MPAPHPLLFALLFTLPITAMFYTALLKHNKSKFSEFKTNFFYMNTQMYTFILQMKQYIIIYSLFGNKKGSFICVRNKYSQFICCSVYIIFSSSVYSLVENSYCVWGKLQNDEFV